MAEGVKQEIKLNSWNRRYLSLCKYLGKDLALFCCCAVGNKPYIPDMEYEDWIDYLDKCKDVGDIFADGSMEIRQVVERTYTDEERWRNTWGAGDSEKPYTISDYKRLDDLFTTYSSRLERAGGMDALQEDTLRSCSKMRLEADKALAKGGKDNISIASTLNKMIQDNLSSEQLRKKDEKPVEEQRLDGIVTALSKKYGVSMEMTMEDALEMCSKWMISHRYPMTLDAVENVIRSIVNCTRLNNDLPQMIEDEDTTLIDKTHMVEFAKEQNDLEKETYKYLKLERKIAAPKKINTETDNV